MDIIAPYILLVVIFLGLFALRTLLSFLIAPVTAFIYLSTHHHIRQPLHFLQGGLASLLAIYGIHWIAEFWKDDFQLANIAMIMVIVAGIGIYSSHDKKARREGVFADQVGSLIPALILIFIGFETPGNTSLDHF